jgi:hypothetical protein
MSEKQFGDPYRNKPNMISDPNTWHEMSFQISIDESVDWDKFDLRTWAHAVAKYTALVMAKTTLDEGELETPEVIKTLIMGIKASRISFVTDDDLHNMIDEFGDE